MSILILRFLITSQVYGENKVNETLQMGWKRHRL